MTINPKATLLTRKRKATLESKYISKKKYIKRGDQNGSRNENRRYENFEEEYKSCFIKTDEDLIFGPLYKNRLNFIKFR